MGTYPIVLQQGIIFIEGIDMLSSNEFPELLLNTNIWERKLKIIP